MDPSLKQCNKGSRLPKLRPTKAFAMMGRMKRLFYIRHAQTDFNIEDKFTGHSEALLTKSGQQQAISAGKSAKTTLPTFDVIICSPLQRAYQTAELISEQLGYPIDKIEINPLFIERSLGILEGTKAKDFFSNHEFHELDQVQGVETIEQLQVRARKALHYVKLRNENDILIVGHAAFGSAFIGAVDNLPYALDKEPRNGEIIQLI